jgi:hypothetical protein
MDNPLAKATSPKKEDPVIKANLAAVEAHFHNEGLNEIEKACELYTDDIVWEAPARNLRFAKKQDVIEIIAKCSPA